MVTTTAMHERSLINLKLYTWYELKRRRNVTAAVTTARMLPANLIVLKYDRPASVLACLPALSCRVRVAQTNAVAPPAILPPCLSSKGARRGVMRYDLAGP